MSSRSSRAKCVVPMARGGGLVLDQVEVRGRIERKRRADWACATVLPREQVMTAALVVPQAAAEEDDDTAAAQVVPGRVKQVVPRGRCKSQRSCRAAQTTASGCRARGLLVIKVRAD
jgi:hypothetical protein